MAKAGARFRLGEHIWECLCGELCIMGQKCRKCGRTNADKLIAEAKAKPKVEKSEQSPKRKSKYREPASTGEFITSYCFKKK